MMRRSRISVKPNFRPGNRTGTEGEQASQRVSVAGDTLLAVDAEERAKPAPSHQQNVTLKEPPEDVGLKETPEMPSQLNQHDGAPSSGAATSTPAPHRRMRISATPKLLGPKFSSTPRSRPSARMPSSAPSSLPNKEHVQTYDLVPEAQDSVSLLSSELSESGTPGKSKSATELPTQSCTMTQLSSLCIPSTYGLQKTPLHGKKSVGDSPPSPQPGQVPQQPPQEPESPECPSTSDLFSGSTKLSYSDKAGSSELTKKSSDKDQILRALKLKELMKIERRKDIKKEKRKVGYKKYKVLDRSKMTMRDLIYYLPNTSPMRSSVVHEENPAENNIPPSPKEQIKTADDDEEEEEDDDEFENEDMLVPKVRVAEDGSIILDEESLTVRVQRTSDTKVVENSAALFERGSTTTYTSFRAVNHVKSWSVRETDLFFLAMSMVGTDFSLIGQLLTNRSRAAIKSKFKKEERVNSWRVDKALRNKRPFDKEFFSYLLEKVLAKDKDKRKAIKLVLPKTKKTRRSKGKTSKEICVDDDDVFHSDDLEDLEDDGAVTVEKESQEVSNVKEADVTVLSKKMRKRRRDKDNSTEEEVKRKRQRKCSKKTRELHSKDDTEGEQNLNVEGEVINANEVDELERSTSASKRRHKRSKGNENEKPVKEIKHKRNKKSLKGCDHEESFSQHEESSVDNEEDSAIPQNRKRVKNSDLDGNEPVMGKKTTKRKKALKIEEEGTAEGGHASAGLQEAEQLNATVTAEVADNVSVKGTRRSKKPLPKLARTQSKETNEPQASAEVQKENRNEKIHESILTAAGSPLQDERLQMQAVVVLEKTPPRHQYLLSPSKDKGANNELEPSMRSPSSSESSSTPQTRMGRARKVKRDLSTIRKAGKRKETMARVEPEPENPMVLLESIARESEDENDDYSLNENLMDMSCLSDLDSQMFQRKPMVVLSREEVDKILHASEQSAEEDPSVSPLDLSLNTELSFPLQCSKILEDNEEAVVDCMFEEHEERTNESISSEARNCEELEPALVQPDISNLRDISTSVKPEVCSQPEVGLSNITTSCPIEEAEPQVHPMAHKDVTTVAAVLDLPPPLVVLDNVDALCMKTDEAVATTVDTSVVVLDVKEKSEKAMLPSSLKEPRLASPEITAQSKLTSLGRGLGSQRHLQADTEVKGEFQMSLKGSSETLETIKDSSASKEDTQESAMARSKIKARTQSCAVALEVKEDSQEEVSVQSSASISSEHGIKPTRRSKFLKPKPNLSQKSRATVLQNQRQHQKSPSTFNSKSSEPSKIHDLSDAVPDQENNTTVNLSLTSADEPQEASECSKSDADMIPPSTSPQPSQTREHPSVGQMIVPSENVCVPAEIVHLSEESHNDEEPTFILTLYEIPVTETYLPSAINDSEMTSDLPTPKTQAFLGFSDQAQSLPSTSESSSITALHEDSLHDNTEQCERVSHVLLGDVFVPVSEETGIDTSKGGEMAVECKPESNEASTVGVTEDLAQNDEEQISKNLTSHEPIFMETKNEESAAGVDVETGNPHLDPHTEGKNDSEIAPIDDLASSTNSIPSGLNILKGITSHQDFEDSERVPHVLLADVFVPASEKTGDDSSKDWTMSAECKEDSRQDLRNEELTKVGNSPGGSDPPLCFDSTEEAKDTPPLSEKTTAPARRRARQKVKPQPKLVKRACSKFAFSKTDEVAKELRQPNSTRAVLPASHEENLPGNSNTSTEESGKSSSSIGRNKTSASRFKGVKHKSIADESPNISKGDLEPTEKNPSALHLSKEPKLVKENIKNIMEEYTIKDDTDSFAEEKEQSSSEGAKVQPCCEDMHFNLMKSSGSASSTVDSEETEAESQGVSHMVLDDVFVLVSDETDANLSNDWRVRIEGTKEAGTHFQKELKTKNESQTSIEESTQSPSTLEETKTPVRKRADKQGVKRKCTKHDSTKTSLSQQTSSQARTPSAQVPSVPQNDNPLLLEEKLQRKHNIMPCTIRLSSLDTVAQSLNAPQLGDMTRSDTSIGISSPTCHASGTTVSEESSTPEFDDKSPSRRKGKKKESSTDTKHSHLKPVQTVSQTRQLTITDWVKKKSAKKQEEKQPMESSHMQSGLKANEEHQFLVEKTCSKSQQKDLEKPEGSDLVPTLEETEDVNRVSTEIQDVKRLSEMVKELTKDPTVSQVKNSPVRRRAKLQVKPILSKNSCIKSEGNTSTSDQPQPTCFTSPTRQHARAARKKEEYDNKKKQSVEEVTNTSSMETNSMVKESFLVTSGPHSPKSNDIWPRVVLPRVKLWTTEEGVYSTSSTCTSSLASLSQSASPPVTPPQLKKSPTQSSSPTASENLDDDPSRVSQFFLCDIFTEVEESE
ncbi:uncharacterized protein LOC132855383 [Tachysurus vachellii]|uniref:uncharacterized protein LOC132855383 n=1 Tax=Tachysurus vachellii TaxID=175792 RepID=UPI00296B0985|nr:uncharacterized protein LOC132855383 [Tachysurus vachellii]